MAENPSIHKYRYTDSFGMECVRLSYATFDVQYYKKDTQYVEVNLGLESVSIHLNYLSLEGTSDTNNLLVDTVFLLVEAKEVLGEYLAQKQAKTEEPKEG